jgi:hypothetical protein
MLTLLLRPSHLLRFTIILILLTACAPSMPLRPTTTLEVDATTPTPISTNTSPLATSSASPEATPPQSPLQPTATEYFEPSLDTRLEVVDQSSEVDTSRAGWWSIRTLGSIGQTFRPSFAGLDAIELWTEDQWDDECSGAGARLQVNVRESTIDGPLVGSSFPVVLPDCFKGVTLFGFPSLITLTPDAVYAIEVIVTSDDNWGVVWQQEPDAYGRGKAVVMGATADADLWFQAGLRTSTPLTEAYCRNGLWQRVKRSDGSAFVDQSDCLRSVPAGR